MGMRPGWDGNGMGFVWECDGNALELGMNWVGMHREWDGNWMGMDCGNGMGMGWE